MILLAKSFDVNLSKIDKRFSVMVTSNYSGVYKNEDGNYVVTWKTEPTAPDLEAITVYWATLNETVYNTHTAEESTKALSDMMENAKNFGNAIIVQFAMENVANGITAAGKTRAVADYCQKVSYYLGTGSLYAAKEEMQEIIAANNIPAELSPFVTISRLTTYVNKINAYLGI